MRYSRDRILLLSFLVEGLLTLIFFIWARYRHFQFHPLPSGSECLVGFLACLPLFALNYVLFGPRSKHVPALRSCYEFKDRVVRPLAAELDVLSSAAVALCAGIGEELFFRGVLQTEFGLFTGALAFSRMHFGTAVRKYLFIATLYTCIGVYFGLLSEYYKTVWVPIVAHAAYDFLALLYLRYGDLD